MLPNFLIIGAPRAGTGWMARNLREHPDIYMPRIKEVHFFDKHYEKGIGYYGQFFAGVRKEKAIGEASPSYLFLEQVPTLIKKCIPDIKLIVSLRNPIERIYSRYWNAKARYLENRNLSFEEKIKLKPSFIEEGFYYDHLMRYYNLFQKENILILLFDDLKENPARFLQSIYTFIGVDTEFISPFMDQKINSASSKKELAKSKLLWYVCEILSRIKLLKTHNFVMKLNEGQISPMNRKTKEWLVKEVYLEKNILLSELIGRDLTAWNKIE
jgi:Sulfotransferase domain.